ncbi:MAG: CRTAC1 family protein [Acidobacteriota bacterium]
MLSPFLLAPSRRALALGACLLLLAGLGAPRAFAQAAGSAFVDIAGDPASGLDYRRTPSASSAILDAFKQQNPVTTADLEGAPLKSRGAPGVALADFDDDGDLDLYVTNGPGTPNSLFTNQLAESGTLRFVDVGAASGAGAVDQDSTGVCYGDVDNDGDADLYVLGNAEPNRLFENLGGGVFADVTPTAGVGGGDLTSTSCAFGDLDGDGLLDLVVANAWDWLTPLGLFVPFTFDEPNLHFRNLGDLVFADVSATSGLQDNAFAPPFTGFPAVTWAIAIVDLDLDGDGDVLMADDQGSVPQTSDGGVDRGQLRFFENDGFGQLTDVTVAKGLTETGGWMGLDFGDFNCDGRLDIFASNFSDFTSLSQSGGTAPIGRFPSRWYLADASGGYVAPDLGAVGTTPFGWGTGVLDHDGDGDLDIVYHGGMDLIFFVDASNAGVLLENQNCTGTFVRGAGADPAVDHQRRNVQGVAVGDLDGNGFDDVVSVSNFDAPAFFPLLPVPNNPSTVFAEAAFVPTYAPGPGPGEFTYAGLVYDDGSLAVELNAGTAAGTVQIALVGGAALVSGGQAPRDGIGAVVAVTPRGSATPAMMPIAGGSSYASQHSLTATFGLGDARRGAVDVLWPGGTRNRLYGARAGERIVFPEIPCSYDDDSLSRRQYVRCVDRALRQLRRADVIDRRDRARLRASALRAYRASR